jgi:dephospho-CoA kinase
MSPAQADARIAAQAPLADKLAVATHVIWNEGTLAELETEIDRVAAELIAAAT